MFPDDPVQAKRSAPARSSFYYGWIMLVIASLTAFMSGPGQTYGVSVFVDPMIDTFGWSRTTISGLYTAGSLTAATAMLLVGRLLDRYGARVLLTVVVLLFGLAAIWMSRVSHIVELYIGFTLLRTLGQGSMSLIPSTMVALWFVRLRGRAHALYALGGATSQAALPPFIYLIISVMGWRDTWIVLGIMIWVILLLPSALLVRRSPEAVGLLPDGDRISSLDVNVQDGAHERASADWTLGDALKTKSFWLLILAGSSSSLISTALIFHHVSLLGSKGVDAGTAAFVLSILAPVAIVSNFAAGFLSERYPNRFILMAGNSFLAIAMLSTFTITGNWQAFVYGGLLGLSNGMTMTINSVIFPNYYGRAHLGSIKGITSTSQVAFAALGPLPFGYFFDLTGNYATVMLLFLALPAFSAGAALMASPPQRSRTAMLHRL